MARDNLTFSLQDTDTDDIVNAVGAALRGNLSPAKRIGKVERVISEEVVVSEQPAPNQAGEGT